MSMEYIFVYGRVRNYKLSHKMLSSDLFGERGMGMAAIRVAHPLYKLYTIFDRPCAHTHMEQ